jgi:hypothetical protein
MGIPENHPAIIEAKRRGLIEEPASAATERPVVELQNGPLVQSLFMPPGTWLLPIRTASEANGRDWRKRSNRTQEARRIVSRELGKVLWIVASFAKPVHLHRETLRVKLTRLGGRKLDAANLGPALKAAEDAVAMVLGIDDGDPRWQVEFGQEPGGRVGVRLELIRAKEGAP